MTTLPRDLASLHLEWKVVQLDDVPGCHLVPLFWRAITHDAVKDSLRLGEYRVAMWVIWKDVT